MILTHFVSKNIEVNCIQTEDVYIPLKLVGIDLHIIIDVCRFYAEEQVEVEILSFKGWKRIKSKNKKTV